MATDCDRWHAHTFICQELECHWRATQSFLEQLLTSDLLLGASSTAQRVIGGPGSCIDLLMVWVVLPPQEPGGTLLARSRVVFLINNNNNNNNILCCQRGVFTRVFTSEPFQRRASLSSRGDLLKVDGATQLMIYKCSPFCTLGLWSVVQQTGRGWHWDKWNGFLSGSFVVLRCVGASEPRRGKCINPG